jgi:diguanylate cyclase (GGDEF)-like protein
MGVFSPSKQTYLIDQCFRESKIIFDKLAPMGLFWYKNFELRQFFLFDNNPLSCFGERFPLQTFEEARRFLSGESPLHFASKEHELGTFLLIGKTPEFMLQHGLDFFCASLTISMHHDQEGSKLSVNTKDLLQYILHKTDYTRQMENILTYFINYMAHELRQPVALFMCDKKTECFSYHHSSTNQWKNRLADLKWTIHDFNAFDLEQLPILISKSLSPFSPLVQELEELTPGAFHYLLPFTGKNGFFAFMVFSWKRVFTLSEKTRLKSFMVDATRLIEETLTHTQSIKNGMRYRQLFSVTTKFHSSMNQQEILDEVVESIVRSYPQSSVNLVVTDNGLEPLQEHPKAMECFLKGELRVDNDTLGTTTIYAPLKGHQGVYGIFIIKTPAEELHGEDEWSFINLQATTAGHALENAKLYQQSQASISDLQLIIQASEQMNRHFRMGETISYLLKLITGSFQAEEVGFFTLGDNNEWESSPDNSPVFNTPKATVFIDRLSYYIKKDGEALFLGDLANEIGWKDSDFRSLMAVPMQQDGEILGFVVALHKKPYQFTFDGFKVLQALVHHSTLALINARLRDELERLVITDQLTKLSTRHYLNERINLSFTQDGSGSLLLIDLDDFKQINDTYGHLIGDQVLTQVAQIIKRSTRKEDIAARWGGEELAVYFPNTSLHDTKAIVGRIVERVKAETHPQITISCGLSYWQSGESETNHDELFIKADEALYLAKRSGKNRIECYL